MKSCSIDSTKVQHVKWCMKQTKLTSEICYQTDSCLAQLAEHLSDDLPLGAIFDEIYFVLCNFRSVR